MSDKLQELASDVLRHHSVRVSHPQLKDDFNFKEIFFHVNCYGDDIENVDECEGTAIWERFVYESYGVGDDQKTFTNFIETLQDDYLNYHYESDDESLFSWEWD